MFASKAAAYSSVAPFSCSTLGQAPDHTHKYKTRLERIAKDKCFNFLWKDVSYGRKKFYNIGRRLNKLETLDSTSVDLRPSNFGAALASLDTQTFKDSNMNSKYSKWNMLIWGWR